MRVLFCLFLLGFQLALADQKTDIFKIGNQSSNNDKVIEFVTDKPNESFKIRANLAERRLQFSNDGTLFSDISSASPSLGRINLIHVNPDFKEGTLGWITSQDATLKLTQLQTDAIFGERSGVFKPTKDNQWLETHSYVLPKGLAGNNCEASLYYATEQEYALQVIQDEQNESPIAERTLAPSSRPKQIELFFRCPDQGKLKLRIVSKGSQRDLTLDRIFLGEVDLDKMPRAEAAFVGGIQYNGCTWRMGSSTGHKIVYQCSNSPVLLGKAKALLDQDSGPSVKFPSLPPGHYILSVVAQGAMRGSGADSPSFCRYDLWDNKIVSTQYVHQNVIEFSPLNFRGDLTINRPEDRTFHLQVSDHYADTCSLGTGADELHIFLYRMAPLEDTSAFHLHQTGWTLRGRLAGVNFLLNETGSYNPAKLNVSETFANDDNVAVTKLSDTIPFTLASIDGKKINGVVFTPETMGKLQACVSFDHTLTVNQQSDVLTRFKLIFSPADLMRENQNVRVSEEFITHRVENLVSTQPKTDTSSFKLCSIFEARTVNPVAIRLAYLQNILSGSSSAIKESSIISETSHLGSPIIWEIRPLSEEISTPLFTHSVSSSFEQGSRIESAIIDTSKPQPVVAQEMGSWLGVISKVSTGDWNIPFKNGIFSTPPICTITPQSTSLPIHSNIFEVTASTLRVKTWSQDKAIDAKFNLFCHGIRKNPI